MPAQRRGPHASGVAGDLELPGLDFDQRAEWLRQHLRHEIQRRRREKGDAWKALDEVIEKRERRNAF